MEITEFVRTSGEGVHRMLGIAMEDLTDEVVHWRPGGTANSIAQLLAHAVTGQDLLFNNRINGGKTLHESGWAQKTGIPLDRPGIWEPDGWRLDLAAFNEFRLEVEAVATATLASLTPEDLDRQVEWVRGPVRPLGGLLQTVFIHHILGHCGEISTIKGLQGLKGLPM